MFTTIAKLFRPTPAQPIAINEFDMPLPTGIPTISLAASPSGHRVRIASLDCGPANCRLMGMGLVPGAELDIVQCAANGCVIVSLQHNRMGFDSKMAQQIQVIDEGKPSPLSDLPSDTLSNGHQMKLREATIGTTLKIIGYEPTAREYKRKLLAMGLTPNTEIVLKRMAPLGDPIEIEVRGYHLTVRKAEADALIVITI